MALLNGIGTLIAMCAFGGIVWWAYSSGRVEANKEASMLPFVLPDESPSAEKEGGHE